MTSARGQILDDSTGLSLDAEAEVDTGGVWVKLGGYGQLEAHDGDGYVIRVEVWNGRPQVVVWPNINSAEPVIIDLSAAAENLRRAT